MSEKKPTFIIKGKICQSNVCIQKAGVRTIEGSQKALQSDSLDGLFLLGMKEVTPRKQVGCSRVDGAAGVEGILD